VIIVSNTAAPTVLAIDSIGAVPVFVDADPDTYVFTPDVFLDERGLFVAPMQQAAFPAQVSYNRSHRGVVRGIHYTRTPPGCAKYVHCPWGQCAGHGGRPAGRLADVRAVGHRSAGPRG
jgi:hypothetical protein